MFSISTVRAFRISLVSLLLQSANGREDEDACEGVMAVNAYGIPFLTQSTEQPYTNEGTNSLMSTRAQLFNLYLKFSGMKRKAKFRYQNPERSEVAMDVPAKLFSGWSRKVDKLNGRRITTLEPSGDTRGLKQIVFFHGGAYVSQITKFHWRFLDTLAKKFNCAISVLEYPLSPEHTVADAIEFSVKAYALIEQQSQRDIILMGDSAGAGLALSLSQTLLQTQVQRQPKKLVLLSPWLDASFRSMPSIALQERDLMLSVEALKDVAARYSGNLGVINPLLSPLYGQLTGLAETGVWYGGSEIFSPDIETFKGLLDKAQVKNKFSLTPHMQHDFVLFPIPEAKIAIDSIVAFLR